MSRPARSLKAAVDSGAPPRYRVKPIGFDASRSVTGGEASRNGTHYIVVNEVPKTATPHDILRALRESNVVGKDFPMSRITMPPPSFPRGGSVTKNVHITLSNVSRAEVEHAVDTLLGRPLFPECSTWAQSPRPASNLGLKPDIPAFPTANNAHRWVNGISGSIPDGASGPGPSVSGQGWRADVARVIPEKPSVEWSMDNRTRGRRVLVRGLPGLLPEWRIRRLGSDCGVESEIKGVTDREDVKRLPSSIGSFSSTWVVTTDTVTNACRLVRKLNRQFYSREKFGERYIMRAEVIW